MSLLDSAEFSDCADPEKSRVTNASGSGSEGRARIKDYVRTFERANTQAQCRCSGQSRQAGRGERGRRRRRRRRWKGEAHGCLQVSLSLSLSLSQARLAPCLCKKNVQTGDLIAGRKDKVSLGCRWRQCPAGYPPAPIHVLLKTI